jgi:hypothetical protein
MGMMTRGKQQDFLAAIQSESTMLQFMLVVVAAQRMRRTFEGDGKIKQGHWMYTSNKDVALPYPDAKVANKLCIDGGPCFYLLPGEQVQNLYNWLNVYTISKWRSELHLTAEYFSIVVLLHAGCQFCWTLLMLTTMIRRQYTSKNTAASSDIILNE